MSISPAPICADLTITCTIQAWPWEQGGQGARGRARATRLIAGLALSPENGALYDFSNIYLMLPGRFVMLKDAAAGFDPAQLAGKTIAVRKGSAHAMFVTRYLPESKLVEFDSEIAALEAVRDKQGDAFFGDAMRASFWFNANPECCAFAGLPYFRPEPVRRRLGGGDRAGP